MANINHALVLWIAGIIRHPSKTTAELHISEAQVPAQQALGQEGSCFHSQPEESV